MSIKQITQNHAKPFPTYLHFRFPSKSMQILRTHLTLFCYTAIYPYWPTHVKTPIFSQCNLVSQKRALRSIPKLHHWKDLLLAVSTEYKLDRVWIRGSGVIGSQSPKILTPDLVDPRPRDPLLIMAGPKNKVKNVDPEFGRTTWPPTPTSPHPMQGLSELETQ